MHAGERKRKADYFNSITWLTTAPQPKAIFNSLDMFFVVKYSATKWHQHNGGQNHWSSTNVQNEATPLLIMSLFITCHLKDEFELNGRLIKWKRKGKKKQKKKNTHTLKEKKNLFLIVVFSTLLLIILVILLFFFIYRR